jgi:F-type H+-transporting ATPase subunit epsilon
MNSFRLRLFDTHGSHVFEDVRQCIAADESGQFGILPGHQAMVVVLRYGLARFCAVDGVWRYLALPGGVLRFAENELTIVTQRYFLDDDRHKICEKLAQEMANIDSELHRARATLTEIEHSLVKRLAALSQRGAGEFFK